MCLALSKVVSKNKVKKSSHDVFRPVARGMIAALLLERFWIRKAKVTFEGDESVVKGIPHIPGPL